MSKSHPSCPTCGCLMSSGFLRLLNAQRVEGVFDLGVNGIRVAFVVPGTKTSPNPLKAFAQGLRDEPDEQVHDLSKMAGYRCEKCGYLEFYAAPPEPHPLDD